MSTPSAQSAIPAPWEIEWRVLQVTAQQCDLNFESLTPDSRLIEDLGIDSLEVVELIMGLEEEFGVTIPDEAAQEVFTHSPTTLRSLAVLVRQRWGTGTPARDDWRHSRPVPPPAEEVPFTQLWPAPEEHRREPLYEPLGPNREGYAEYRRRTDGMRCVLVPADATPLGTDSPDAQADQGPVHTVRLSEFLMDAEPVSHAAFGRFLNSVGDVPPPILAEWCGVNDGDKRRAQFALRRDRHRWTPTPGTERLPMILVSWFGANAYSLWAHGCDWRLYRSDGATPEELTNSVQNAKRDSAMAAPVPPVGWGFSHLPSEAQWEYAARGGETPRVPPEGSLAAGTSARVAQHAAGTNYQADTLPAARVSERLGMSPFGLHHMAGNVWQWCRDWFAPDFYQRPEARLPNPQNGGPTGIRSERGGSWVGPSELAAPWYRRGRPPEARGRCLGFRCVGVPGGESRGNSENGTADDEHQQQ